MNNSVIRCCHNCPDRFIKEVNGKIVRCHSSCEKYKKQKERFEKIREEERKEAGYIDYVSVLKRKKEKEAKRKK